jgi:hypothetical protein
MRRTFIVFFSFSLRFTDEASTEKRGGSRISGTTSEKRIFSGENFWFCAVNECLFWGKFVVENYTLLQRALSAGKIALSTGRVCAPPAPPMDPPMITDRDRPDA